MTERRPIFDEIASVRAIALLRILVGPITIVHLWSFLEAAQPGSYFAERFYVPFTELWPVLPLEGYRAVLLVGLVAAVLMSAGFLSRLTSVLTLAVVVFNLFSNQLFFHHNRAFLTTILFGLTLLPAGRALSVDAWLAKQAGHPLRDEAPMWRLVLLRALACTPYLASGFSKLIDPDWWSGVVMYDRISRYRHVAEAKGVPAWLIDPIATPEFNAVMWKLVVLTELFVGVGYWFRRTRVTAMFMALGFHTLIEITSTVSVFSYLGIAATLIWVTPRTRDRVLWVRTDEARGRRLARLVRALDWLARFDLRETTQGPTVRVRDRDGTILEGAPARRLVLSRLPPLMPLVTPLLLLDQWPRRTGQSPQSA
ncbi:MAG: HTTM domain-containing protein [Deltaproteobacteria bacterium]|nr:HTTM domain-containing protein [Deltaproteobacteria bacterium]